MHDFHREDLGHELRGEVPRLMAVGDRLLDLIELRRRAVRPDRKVRGGRPRLGRGTLRSVGDECGIGEADSRCANRDGDRSSNATPETPVACDSSSNGAKRIGICADRGGFSVQRVP
jgi:hypothetical protein